MSRDAEVVPLGPLQKRASRIISQAGLYELVQDMATKVDALDPRLNRIERRLDLILEKLNG
jgi:hypothetical protein